MKSALLLAYVAALSVADTANAQSLASPKALWEGSLEPLTLALVDIDGVAPLEMVAACGSSGVQILDEAGGSIVVASPTAAPGAFRVIGTDLDGDGVEDVIWSTTGGSGRIGWSRGLGGTLGTPQDLVSTGLLGDVRGLCVADLDFDGVKDLAFAGSAGVGYFRGTVVPGGYALDLNMTWLVQGVSCFAVTVGDLDGDGAADVMTGVGNELRSYAGGVSGPTSGSFSVVAGGIWGIRSILHEDFDGDGDLDLAIASSGTAGNPGVVSTLHCLGGGAFAAPQTHLAGSLYRTVVGSDFDRDGDLDLIVTAANTAEVWLIGGGGGQFESPRLISSTSPDCYGAAVGDLDQDGDQDVIVCVVDSVNPGGRLDQIDNLQGFGFAPGSPLASYSGIGLEDELLQVALIDVDRDGDLDILELRPDLMEFRRNNGGLFGSPEVFFTGPLSSLGLGPIHDLVPWDVDGDGWEEVVVGADSGWIVVSTAVVPAVAYSVGALEQGAYGARLTDFQSDGILDSAYLISLSAPSPCDPSYDTGWRECRVQQTTIGGIPTTIAGRQTDDYCDGQCDYSAEDITPGWLGRKPSSGFHCQEFDVCYGPVTGVIHSSAPFAWQWGFMPDEVIDLKASCGLEHTIYSAPYWDGVDTGIGQSPPPPSRDWSGARFCQLVSQGQLEVVGYGNLLPGGATGVFWTSIAGGEPGPERLLGETSDVLSVTVADLNGDQLEDVLVATVGGTLVIFESQMSQDDCDGNGVADWVDLASGAGDCDLDGVLDSCQVSSDYSLDWDGNGALDSCSSEPTYCDGNLNAVGLVSTVELAGSPVIADNDLTLTVRNLPQAVPAYFVFSANTGYVNPFGGGNGVLCLGAPIRRFNPFTGYSVLFSSAAGEVSFSPDLANLPQPAALLPGDTLHFQLWHREFDASTGGMTSNTSSAVRVMFR